MFAETRMSDFLRQPAMQVSLLLVLAGLLLEFLEKARRESFINDVVRQNAEVLRSEAGIVWWRVGKVAEAKELLVIVRWKRADIRLQFFRDPGFQNFRQRVLCALPLVASCLVDEGNDADSRETTN